MERRSAIDPRLTHLSRKDPMYPTFPSGEPCSRRTALARTARLTAALGAVAAGPAGWAAEGSPETAREFIYETAPFPACHASTVVETRQGLMAAWFGGSNEGNSDVCIYTSHRHEGGWTPPVKVADGWVEKDGRRYPCWNPVLFLPRQGPLFLFYKVGPRPSSWWGLVRTSTDHGRTWSEPTRLPPGILGPIRAKPIQLPSDRLLCPSSTEHAGWQVQMEFTRDPLRGWSKTEPLNRADEWGAIQPTILHHGQGEIQILCRSKQGSILESWSADEGKSWSPLVRTTLPNNNSGIDAVKLADGRFLLVYNHLERGRHFLNVALSQGGRRWLAAHVLENEPGEFSYPAAILARDGLVHITYTWNRRRIRHVALDPERLQARPFVEGAWPGQG